MAGGRNTIKNILPGHDFSKDLQRRMVKKDIAVTQESVDAMLDCLGELMEDIFLSKVYNGRPVVPGSYLDFGPIRLRVTKRAPRRFKNHYVDDEILIGETRSLKAVMSSEFKSKMNSKFRKTHPAAVAKNDKAKKLRLRVDNDDDE